MAESNRKIAEMYQSAMHRNKWNTPEALYHNRYEAACAKVLVEKRVRGFESPES